jgi:hypothetical protein
MTRRRLASAVLAALVMAVGACNERSAAVDASPGADRSYYRMDEILPRPDNNPTCPPFVPYNSDAGVNLPFTADECSTQNAICTYAGAGTSVTCRCSKLSQPAELSWFCYDDCYGGPNIHAAPTNGPSCPICSLYAGRNWSVHDPALYSSPWDAGCPEQGLECDYAADPFGYGAGCSCGSQEASPDAGQSSDGGLTWTCGL